MKIVDGRDVSLATNRSILVPIRIRIRIKIKKAIFITARDGAITAVCGLRMLLIASRKDVVFSSAIVSLFLSKIRKNYSTDFHKNSVERLHISDDHAFSHDFF